MALDSFDDINAAFEFAQTKRLQGNFLKAYDQLLDLFTTRLMSAQLMDADLKIIQALADLAGLLGEFHAADDLLQGAIERYAAANDDHCADYARLRRTQIHIDSGQLTKAREQLQEMAPRIGNIQTIQFSPSGLTQWEAGCHWFDTDLQERTILFTELYLAMGRLLAALGQYGDALTVLERGLLHTTGEKVPSLAEQTVLPMKLAIAAAHLEKGELAAANHDLTTLQIYLDKQAIPDYSIRHCELSGKLHLLQGNFGKALEQFQQIQSNCRDLGIQSTLLRSTLNLAHVLILLNQISTAEQYLMDAHSDALVIDDVALIDRAILLRRLMWARTHSLAIDGPEKCSEEDASHTDDTVLSINQAQVNFEQSFQSPNYLTWFEDRALALHLYMDDRDLKTSTKLLRQIQAVFQFTDSSLIKTQIQVLEGTLAFYQGKIRQANTILEAVRPTLEIMGLKPELWQIQQQFLIECRARLNYPHSDQQALAESTNSLLTQLTESLSPEDQATYLLNKWTADEKRLAFEINQIQQLQAKLRKGQPWLRPWRQFRLMQRLSTLVQHIDRYKDVLAKRTLKQQLIPLKLLPTAFLWHQLLTHPKHHLTLSFLVLPNRVLVIRLGRFMLDFRVIAASRLEVRKLVQDWHNRIKGINGGRDINPEILKAEYEAIKKISGDRDINATPDVQYEVVMESVADDCRSMACVLSNLLNIPSLLADLPEHIRSLTIIPDDILHGFPFAVLPYKKEDLVKRYALSICYETGRQRSRKNVINRNAKALVVGVSKGNDKISSLPYVSLELQKVHGWLESCHINSFTLEDSSATKKAIFHSLLQADLFHIACHGIFQLNRPDQSGMVLIPGPKQQEEILSLRELSETDLSKLRHATLSSCWSADHFILPGRWVISLPETMWRSGTESILGCLWKVDDQLAVSFMTQFYSYLAEGYPRDKALHETQLQCLHEKLPNCEGIDIANPFFWAGFTLYGNYTPLFSNNHRRSRHQTS